MISPRYWTPALGASLALALASGGVTVRSLVRAITLAPLPKTEPPGASVRSAVLAERAPVVTASATVAVDRAPFRPDRRRPPERFRMPGERLPGSAVADTPGVSAITLIGTAVIGSGGFAMCQRGTDPPKLVRVGEKFGDLSLQKVRQGRAVFRTREGAALELRIIRAPPATAAPEVGS